MAESAEQTFIYRPRKSKFIRKFTKVPRGAICPQVYVLSHANGCPYSCDYCYLQLTFRYMDTPEVFSNRHELLRDVRQFLALSKPTVLHMGKLSDGLAFDLETGLSKDLVPLFHAQNKHKLLLLTKSTNVQNLLDMPEHQNTIVSFSLNAPELARRFEHGAPSPYERIKAAKVLQDAGYEVRIRLDPVIPVPGWQELYRPLVDAIVAGLDTDGLRITIGHIRYFKQLPIIARSRGANTTVFNAATFFDRADGRMRVKPELRFQTYLWFRNQFADNVSVAPCKEPAQVWERLELDHTAPQCNCAL